MTVKSRVTENLGETAVCVGIKNEKTKLQNKRQQQELPVELVPHRSSVSSIPLAKSQTMTPKTKLERL